jgi:hypothetical protein
MPRSKGCLLHAISLLLLALGLFCMYRALAPILQLYADALSDPLGNSTAEPDPAAIKQNALVWAPIGLFAFVVASVLSWIATAGWIKKRLQSRK